MTVPTTFLPQRLRAFLCSPAGGACALLLASVLGFGLANSPWAGAYGAVAQWPLRLAVLGAPGPHTLTAWVSDGLMALFFLSIILEIRQEISDGHLSSPPKVALPLIGALGGMVVPALVYVFITRGAADAAQGWAIPIATDAAFTLPIILLLGTRVAPAARVWLMALAVFDDLLGIAVIAIFYSSAPCWPALGCACMVLAGLVAARRGRVVNPCVYGLGGVLLWGLCVRAGVQPTLAGVAIGACLPAPLARPALNAVVTWGVLPLFGFLNVGVSLAGAHMGMLLAPVPLGVLLGLVVGKPVGVFGASVLAARLGLASLPEATSLHMLFGLSLLCGIGFTISLFIASLAFTDPALVGAAKLGIVAGSLVAALSGWLWLRFGDKP
ncbi:Na+/H+ antiporter NhaA [Komagataeibacter sucrofermentans]|uniref:Na(+)/H(+) antiporter NhaA n=1 Tax=Komagataeibacter sucrofermentans TaxID=1053551 RepID=A0A318R3F9_9PROT|nr:Na+/H+ antiporter NhaA [Komagataeibacter sucrofermentans]PYD80453.1 Na+/H+ antiporter NhaA [Komagataeibacter sucrofermentans]